MWIFKGKGSFTLKICGKVPLERLLGVPVSQAIPLVLSGNDSCPKVKLSKNTVKIKDDYHSTISLGKDLIKKLEV
jgi:hypothetical protein